MRILVDTSVWSLSLKKGAPKDHPQVIQLRDLILRDQEVFITGIILQETLQSFRDDVTFQRIRTYLEAFPMLILERSQAVLAANLHRRCASKGIAASTTDTQIAAMAIAYDCSMLSADKDFEYIARHTDLRLFEEKSSR